MATSPFPATLIAPRRTVANFVELFVKEAKYEMLKNIRIPIYAISTIVFPLMFYVLFAIVLSAGNGINRGQSATYQLATMGCFGVMGASLFGFGVSLAMERGQGWLQVKRASPMPIAAYFTAKMVNALTFSVVMPHFLQRAAQVLPPYHISQLALNVVGMSRNPTPAWGHVEPLIGVTLLCLGIAAYGYWRDEGQLYG